MLVGSGLRRRSPKEFEMINHPEVRIVCDYCKYEITVDMKVERRTVILPALYSIPPLEWSGWMEIDGKIICDDCANDPGDMPSETLSAAERNPSLCGRK